MGSVTIGAHKKLQKADAVQNAFAIRPVPLRGTF